MFQLHDVHEPFTMIPTDGLMRHSIPRSGVSAAQRSRFARRESAEEVFDKESSGSAGSGHLVSVREESGQSGQAGCVWMIESDGSP